VNNWGYIAAVSHNSDANAKLNFI